LSRINIEDSIYKDPRFSDLILLLGSRVAAIGALVEAWSLAQKWYLSNDRLVPIEEWQKHKVPDAVIEVGLAKLENGKIRVSGADEQFKWLLQRSDAGKKSHAKSLKKKSVDRNRPLTTDNVRNPLTLSPSPSLTLNSNSTSSCASDEQKKLSSGNQTLGSLIFDSYKRAYSKRYGTDPVRNKTVNSQCKALGDRLGVDAIPVVEFYVLHNDGYFLRDQHPVGLCLAKAESLHTQWKRGSAVTSSDVKNFEKQDQYRKLLDKVEKGEL
jgi:hypothetical protein